MASAGGGGFGDYYGGVYGDIGMEFGDDKGFIYGSATEMMNFHRPVVSGSDSSSTSSSNNGLSASWGIMESQPEAAPEKRRTAGGSGGAGKKSGGAKKAKTEPSATAGNGPLKVRKEKLGDRISALQQLVSPFGKTDTASVLHEAMGYIRFLHDQVQVLSTPYLQNTPASSQYPHPVGIGVGDESRYDLRSRGLCLVPVECTSTVANSNGADFWAPANMNSRRAG